MTWRVLENLVQKRFSGPRFLPGKEKEHKLKLLDPDIFRWGGSLPRGGVGAKKFGKSLEAQERDKLFGGISRDFGWDIPGAPEKLEKPICFQFFGP